MAKAARLATERDGLDRIEFPPAILERATDAKVAELIRTETNFFETRRAAMQQQIRLLEEQSAAARREIDSLRMRADAEVAASKLLEREVAANEKLEHQYVPETHVLSLKRGIEDYKARQGEHLADIARAGQKITDLELRIATTRDRYLQEATEGMTAAQARIFDLQERLRPTRDMQRRQQILAPISGTVVGMNVFTVGGIIAPREPLMDIVPDENELIIEAQINVEDIDDVRVGQEADVRLSAYKRRSTPLVVGEVSYVSADRLTSPDGNDNYYLTRITVTRESLAEAGDIAMFPGMPAEVFIKTGERTALDYMLAPVTNVLRRSFREP
jgi:HlyD family type I secretion membrane fusion protein